MDYNLSAENMMDLLFEIGFSDFGSPSNDMPGLSVGREIVINLDFDIIQKIKNWIADAPGGARSILYFALGALVAFFVGLILVLYWIAFILIGGLIWLLFGLLCPGLKFRDLLLLPIHIFLQRGKVLQKCRGN